MRFSTMLSIEFMKVKRSKIVPLIFIAPILVVLSGIANLSAYFSPVYTHAWHAMFIQSALVYAYYLLPFSMVVVCVMIAGRETQNNCTLKMLALPISKAALSLAKFCVLLFYLLMEMVIFAVVFIIAGMVVTAVKNVPEALPLGYLARWCGLIFLTMLPCLAVLWAITIFFEKALLSVGLNLLLIIPGVLAANTRLWFVYPFCYSGYLVSCSLHDFTTQGVNPRFALFPFLPCAIAIFLIGLLVSVVCFGRKETR